MGALPIFEQVASAKILTTTTSGSGASWVKAGCAGGGPYPCRQISVFNNTGTELQFSIGDPAGASPSGETMELPPNTAFAFDGITDASAVFVRRSDQANTPVTFKSWARR